MLKVTTTKNKFINTIADIAEQRNLQFVHNSGQEIRFEREGSFTPLLKFHYSFGFDDSVYIQGSLPLYFNGIKFSELDRVMEVIKEELTKAGATVQPKPRKTIV